MTKKTYNTPSALESAVKTAAQASSLDTSRAIELFKYDRFLCRIFSSEDPQFVLKGGQSILARIIDARTTRDVDLFAKESSLDDAINRIIDLASVDLGDYITYRFIESEEIAQEIEYRSGAQLVLDVGCF